jgi:hypothetical protein
VLKSDSPEYLLVWLAPVLALVTIDLVTRRRLRPVPFVSGALLVVAFFKVELLASPVWRSIGAALLSPFV